VFERLGEEGFAMDADGEGGWLRSRLGLGGCHVLDYGWVY